MVVSVAFFQICITRLHGRTEEMVVAGFDANRLPSRQSMLDMLNARVREKRRNVLENEFNEPEGPRE